MPVIFFGCLSWWALGRSLGDGDVSYKFILPLISFFVYLAALGILVIVANKKRKALVIAALSVFGYFVFIDHSLVSIAGYVISLAVMVGAIERAFSEKANAVKIKPMRMLRLPMAVAMTSLSLLAAVGYHSSITTGNGRPIQFEFKISNKETGTIVDFLKRLAPQQFRYFEKGVTVDDYANYLIESQIGDLADENGEQLSITSEFSQRQKDLLYADLEKQFGVENVRGDQEMLEIFTSALNKKILDFFNAIPQAAILTPILLAFGFFLSAKTVGAILKPFINFFAGAVLWILVKLQMIKIGTVSKEVQYIE